MRYIRLFLNAIKRAIVFCLTIPFLLMVKIIKFVYVSQAISLIPFSLGEKIRYEFYRCSLASCGQNVTIGFGTIISYPDVTLGNNVRLNTYNNVGHADIGDYVISARNCHFVSGGHAHGFKRTDIPIMKQPGVIERVRVGPDVWLGSGVIVMANIAKGCVIGAGSVVTRPIPPWSVVAGVPAQVIRMRQGPNSMQ